MELDAFVDSIIFGIVYCLIGNHRVLVSSGRYVFGIITLFDNLFAITFVARPTTRRAAIILFGRRLVHRDLNLDRPAASGVRGVFLVSPLIVVSYLFQIQMELTLIVLVGRMTNCLFGGSIYKLLGLYNFTLRFASHFSFWIVFLERLLGQSFCM